MEVTADQDKCISSGQCVPAAGEVFDQRDDDGVVVLLTEAPSADQADDVHRATTLCPAAAINTKE